MNTLCLERRPVTPLAESATRLKRVCSDLVGIVKIRYDVSNRTDDARLVLSACKSVDLSVLFGGKPHTLTGGSFEATRSGAHAACVAEMLERYCGYRPLGPSLMARAADLPRAVDPDSFALYHPRQHEIPDFGYEPFTSSSKVGWIKGFDLATHQPAYLPTQRVYLSYERREDEPSICVSTSNGMALGGTLEEATRSGLFEVVERDAFFITWYNRLSPPRIDWRSDPELCRQEEREFAPTGLQYFAFDLSMFLNVPTVAAVVLGGGPDDTVAFSVGTATAATPQRAWQKAMREAFHTRSWVRYLRLQNYSHVYQDDYSDIKDFTDHIRFYADPRNYAATEFLTASSEVKDIRSIPSLEGTCPLDHIEATVSRLRQHGVSAYVVDMTTPDVRQANLSVARVVCPELAQIDVDYQHRFLGGSRLYEAAWKAGLRTAPLSFDDINPNPHPFP